MLYGLGLNYDYVKFDAAFVIYACLLGRNENQINR